MEGYKPVDSFDESNAARYDDLAVRGDEEVAVAFLERIAGGGPALELGIGTGRIALPLAARGVEVHGIDLSEPARIAGLPPSRAVGRLERRAVHVDERAARLRVRPLTLVLWTFTRGTHG